MSQSIFAKSAIYYEVSSGRYFAVLLYKKEYSRDVEVAFIGTPDFVKELSKKGVQITWFLCATSVDVFLKKNGCKFVRRLPISPETEIFEAVQSTDAYLKAFRFFNK